MKYYSFLHFNAKIELDRAIIQKSVFNNEVDKDHAFLTETDAHLENVLVLASSDLSPDTYTRYFARE